MGSVFLDHPVDYDVYCECDHISSLDLL